MIICLTMDYDVKNLIYEIQYGSLVMYWFSIMLCLIDYIKFFKFFFILKIERFNFDGKFEKYQMYQYSNIWLKSKINLFKTDLFFIWKLKISSPIGFG